MSVVVGGKVLQIPGMEVLAELGRGANTQVFRCRRRGRDYAVKVGLALLADDAGASVMFRREAAILATARHQALAEIFEVGEVGGRPYLVMELCEGRTLTQVAAEGPLPQAALVRVGVDVAGGLAEAHRRGVVHLDVKPDNIIVGADGRARIIDFGLAGYVGAETSEAVTGTLHYAAPEQTGMLKRPVDRRADLYGLGVVLFEAASGVRPFVSADPGEVVRMHAVTPAPALAGLRPDLDESVGAIVAKLLAKDPDDRYQSADGLVADLEAVGERPGLFPLDRRGDAGTDSTWPFVGRGSELAVLGGAWTAAREGQLREVAVEGPVGIGKTRLVQELVGGLAAEGVLVLSAVCSPGDPVPFAAVREAFNAYLRSVTALADDGAEAARARLVGAAGPFGRLIGSLSPALAQALGTGLGATDRAVVSDDRGDQFTVTFALFLVELARRAGGMVLWIDDAQWIDDASAKLLARLTSGDDQGPILVVRTVGTGLDPRGDDGDEQPGCTRLALAPLATDVAAGLVVADLHGGIDAEFADRVALRSGGNPLALLEYLRAVVDAGVIQPHWGRWRVDQAGLDSLALPAGVVELVLRRIDRIGSQARAVLVVAAAIGTRFDLELLAEVCQLGREAVTAAIADAVAASLVEMHQPGAAGFLHERIRDALLSTLEGSDRRRLHQAIAEAADDGDPEGEALFALARHYQLGVPAANPARLIVVSRRAARAAQELHASGESHTFLTGALAAAIESGLDVDADFEQEVARACLLDGRPAEATEHYQRTVALSRDPWARAAARAELARIDLADGRSDHALVNVTTSLRDIRRPLRRNWFARTLTPVVELIVALVIGRTKIGFGTARGQRREHYATQVLLCEAGGVACQMRGDIRGMLWYGLAGLYPANRLGISPEYIRVHCVLCRLAAGLHRHRAVNRAIPRLARFAEESGIPSLIGFVALSNGVAAELLGDGTRAADLYRSAFNEYGRWLDPSEKTIAHEILIYNLLKYGHHIEAGQLAHHPNAKVPGTLMEAVVAYTLGRASPDLLDIDDLCHQAQEVTDGVTRTATYDALIDLLVEQGQIDATFDQVIALRDAEPYNVLTTVLWARPYWVSKANGMMIRWRRAEAGSDRADLAELRSAARAARNQLRWTARCGGVAWLRASSLVVDAEFAELDGKPDRALPLLDKAERLANGLDAPAVRFGVLRQRARCLSRLGLTADATTEARLALALATQQGWVHRASRVLQEFALAAPTVSRGSSAASTVARSAAISNGGTSSSPYSRRLAALLQVSVAAASVIDPRQLARIALDEALVILGAERAFLFLVAADGDSVTFFAGRDSNAADLTEAVGYSSTAVEQARCDRQALVVTGSDEGYLIGSASAVVHGLRSILVAPLQLEGRLIGVVYLDSRLATGMFTDADVDILVAIATQVAVSLETARSAQLEMLIHTERQQRSLVEGLRDVLADMTSTFDPTEVLHRLLVGLERSVPYDAATVVVVDSAGAGWVLAERPPRQSDTPPTPATHLRALGGGTHAQNLGAIVRLLAGEAVLDANAADLAPICGQTFTPRSWLAVPLPLSDTTTAIVVVASATANAYGDTQLEIARTVVAYGAVAYQNARLFTSNRRLAVTDELSGLDNRRSFFDQATAMLAEARHHRQPLSAIMVDIDHFKDVNDTHGHATGDDVIQAVAERLAAVARAGDLVARYGGEEFALLIAGSADHAVAIAERLRRAIADKPITTRDRIVSLTVSVGVTNIDTADATIEEILSRADAALYRAKTAGRNRVAHHQPESATRTA
ncbi:MAG: diguanylate cyclase [Acidimicrobiales bacterium]